MARGQERRRDPAPWRARVRAGRSCRPVGPAGAPDAARVPTLETRAAEGRTCRRAATHARDRTQCAAFQLRTLPRLGAEAEIASAARSQVIVYHRTRREPGARTRTGLRIGIHVARTAVLCHARHQRL